MLETYECGIELFGICDHNYGIGYGRHDLFITKADDIGSGYGRNLRKYFDHIDLIREKYADKIIVTNDNPRNESEEIIIKELISGFKNTDYSVIYDRESAIRYAIAKASPSDIVVVAGKGHEKYVIDKDGYHPFDERSIIDSALKKRREAKTE